MKPNFALSLSFDGLRLMHRVPGGWDLVGEVALDDADLPAALARLKAAGESLTTEPMTTKLLLPNEQIKYIAIDTTRTTEDDVRASLDGATPYTLDELVYDFSKGGGRTYVAAVARETLTEAEGFAREHGFNPVAFVGVPEPFTYMGEPFFGTAEGVEGVEQDAEPVVVIGHAEVKLATAPEPEPEPEPEADLPAEDTPEPNMNDSAAPPEGTPEDDAPEQAEEAATAADEAAAETDTLPEDGSEADETPVFGSRRDAPEVETPAPVEPEPDTEPATDPVAPASSEPAPAAPVFGSRRSDPGERTDPPPLAVPQPQAEITGGPPLTGAARDDAAPAAADPITTQAPDTPAEAPAVTGMAQEAVPEDKAPALGATLTARRETAPDPAPATDEGKSGIAAAIGAAGGMFASRRARKAEAAEPEVPAPAQSERNRMTVFGARKVEKPKKVVGGKPRFLGLILTVVLILLLLAVAAFAAMNEDTIARWFGWGGDEATQVAAAPDTGAPQSPAVPEVTATDPIPTADPAPDTLGAETTAQATGQVLSPAEAERIYAATGVWQRAPRIPLVPRLGTAEDVTVSAGFPQAERRLPGGLPQPGSVAGDAVIAAPVNPPPPSAEFDFNADGMVVATPDGAVTPDGILVIAGRPALEPPARPGTVAPEVTPQDRLAEIVPEDAAPVETAPDGVLLIAGRPAIEPPARPGTQPPPPAPEAADGASEVIAGNGLVVIAGRPALEPPVRPGSEPPVAEVVTPDLPVEEGLNLIAGRPPLEPPTRPGTAAPAAPPSPGIAEGLIVIAGRPPLEPPTRPGTASSEAATPTPGSVGLAAFQRPGTGDTRPRPRPASVVEEAASAVTVQIAEAATARPRTRPVGLAPEPAPEPEPEQQTASSGEAASLQLSAQIAAAVQEAATRPDPFAGATQLAVASSLRPDTRPRNMDRIVARATEAAAARPAAAAVSRPIAPSGPTPGGVAAAATQENAINLRDINLIGVYGSNSDRRALVRLSNGRYERVTVGDRLDGGRVQAIGENSLVYSKRGRNVTLSVGG